MQQKEHGKRMIPMITEENRAVFYHVSFDCTTDHTKIFKPRIPDDSVRDPEEDGVTARINLCDSVINCISAMPDRLPSYEGQNNVIIDVWSAEISLDDPRLIRWDYLYEHSMVPDAAITHECWYVGAPLRMDKTTYTISNISEALSDRKEKWVIKPKYKSLILDILSERGLPVNHIAALNPCDIINEWLPKNREDYLLITETVIDALRIPCPEEPSNILWNRLFDNPPMQYTKIDAYQQNVYTSLNLEIAGN